MAYIGLFEFFMFVPDVACCDGGYARYGILSSMGEKFRLIREAEGMTRQSLRIVLGCLMGR